MLRAYKYRIYPREDQAKQIDCTINACRLVYNLGLELKIWAYRNGVELTIFDLCRQIKDLRAGYSWISEANSQALHRSLRNLENSFINFFRGGGFPRFKSKKCLNSFQCHNNLRRVDWDNGLLSIPKIHNIPILLSRKFDGKIKTVTISKSVTGKYFASILVDEKKELPAKPWIKSETTIGIDVGVKSFIVTSNGLLFSANRKLKESLKRLQCLQRRASRKRKGGKNRKKANCRVALLREKIANQRGDYIHKVTTQLIRDSQAESFAIENLNIIGMQKNEKLSRSIQDASFGEFFRQMKYKCEWYGKNLIVIDRFAPSSKRCSECGKINDELTLADREWTCACGAHHDRDLNAAKNIKFFGLNTPVGSRGGPVESRWLRRAKKREKYLL